MRILALDTSGQTASVALWEDGLIRGEMTLNTKMNHSRTIMPMVEDVLRFTEAEAKTLDYIACAAGPGSFTGLRIGAATAKGLAHGLNIPVLPVPTLDALAYNVCEVDGIICPIMDARRQQVYTAFYEAEKGLCRKLSEDTAEDIRVTAQKAKELGKSILFLGDGVPVYRGVLEALDEKGQFSFAPAHQMYQRAACVAMAAAAHLDRAIKPHAFVPEYLRLSQAERERAEAAKEAKA